MGDITRPLASLAEDTASVHQAGVSPSATSSSSSFTATKTSINTNTGTKNITSEPQRSNKKPKTRTAVPNDGDNESSISLHAESLHQNNTVTTASSPGPISATTITSSASSARPKPKSKAGKIGNSKTAKKGLSASTESSESLSLEDESAATEIELILEVHNSAEEAEHQLYQHVQGGHEGRDPYGLASQSYLLRGEPVPWWVCKMCKEDEERAREGGTWLSGSRS